MARIATAAKPESPSLELLLAAIADQVIVLDADWRYVYVNDRVSEITGVPRERLLGARVWEVFPDVVGTAFERELRRAAVQRCAARFEYFYAPLARWLEHRVHPGESGLVLFVSDVTERKREEAGLRESAERSGPIGASRDITQHERAEELLQRSHDTFFNLIENAPFGVYIVDANLRLRQASSGAQKVFSGVRPLLGRDLAEVLRILWPEPFATEAIGRFRRTLTTGEGYHSKDTNEARADTGEVESYDWQLQRITLPAGEFGVACYFYDLTERRRIERALADARGQLDAALSGGRIAGWIWDIARDRIRYDARLASFFNLPGAGAAELPAAAYAQALHAEDRPRVKALLDRSIETGAEFEAEYRIVTFDPPRWAYTRARVETGADGRPARMAGVVMDITERKLAEQRIAQLNGVLSNRLEELESLMTVLPLAVFVGHDASCSRITANPAGTALLRIAPGRNASMTSVDAGALPFRFLRGGIEVPPHELPMHRAARLAKPVLGEEIDIGFADGSVVNLYGSAVPLFDDTRRVRGCLGVYVDLTARKRAEHALRDADRRKDEFLATLSHELRNPLAPLRNSLYLLRRSTEPGTAIRVHDMMERQVEHLVRLVDDLMEVSRITRGNFELRRQRVALEQVLRNAVETSDPLIRSGGHRLDLELPHQPLILHADPVRIAQVFANLLNNAAKYTDRGGSISIAARRDGVNAVVEVSDSGQGIEADEMQQLFQMFARSERSSRRMQGGLGIGLALVRKLVEMHGGAVSAHSEGRNRGSRFIVRLPLADGAPVTPAAMPADMRPDSALRVLVVDDNRDAAESMAMLLGELGAQVRIAYDGPQALAAAEAFRPRVVLLDIGLPGMDGYAVARRLRERAAGERLTIIAVTGWGQHEDKARAREAGFDHHLVKPADIDALNSLLAATSATAGPAG